MCLNCPPLLIDLIRVDYGIVIFIKGWKVGAELVNAIINVNAYGGANGGGELVNELVCGRVIDEWVILIE